MQDSTLDKKIGVLIKNYKDNANVTEVQRDVEAIRNKATVRGATATAALFIGNEVSRFVMRQRKFMSDQLTFL